MPLKTTSLLLVLLGLLTVTILILLGRNPRRIVGSGPRWRRLLVMAGLLALAHLGLTAERDNSAALSPDHRASGAGQRGEVDPLLTRALSSWEAVREMTLGRQGAYPVDKKEKRALYSSLGLLCNELNKRAEKKDATGAVAGLLCLEILASRQDLLRLSLSPGPGQGGVGDLPGQQSPGIGRSYLLARLPYLSCLAKQPEPQHPLLPRLIPSLVRAMTILVKGEGGGSLWIFQSPETKKQLLETIGKTCNLLGEIFSGAPKSPGGLAGDPRWQEIVAACQAAYPYQCLTKQLAVSAPGLNRVDRDLDRAGQLAVELSLAGTLRLGELQVLQLVLTRLQEYVQWQRSLHQGLAQPLPKGPGERGRWGIKSRLEWFPVFFRQESPALVEKDRLWPDKEIGRLVLREFLRDMALARGKEGIPVFPEAELLSLSESGRLLVKAKYFIGQLEHYLDAKAAEFSPDPSLLKAELAVQTGDLFKTPRWQRILRVWEEAQGIALGHKGSYPYTNAEYKKLMTALTVAQRDLISLAKSGLLTKVEKEAFSLALRDLTDRAGSFRTREYSMMTCYIGFGRNPIIHSYKRIQARLPLLEKMLGAKKYKPRVLAKTMGVIIRDLNAFEQTKDRRLKHFSKRINFGQLAGQVCDWLERVPKQSLPAPQPLAATREWQVISAACAATKPYQERRKGLPAEELNKVGRKLSAAREAACLLFLRGELTGTESRLLLSEFDRLRLVLDCQRLRSGMHTIFPADTSSAPVLATRKNAWAIPLVLPLARAGKVKLPVLQVVLSGLKNAQVDLRTTSSRVKRHPDHPGLRERSLAAIAELEKLLARKK